MARRRFHVEWSEVAVRDLAEIAGFLALDSVETAERVLDQLEKRTERLETNPSRGRVVPELARFQIRGWRELIVRPYRVIYRLDGHRVSVLAVIDGRREIEDLLLERLLRED